jgi:uncharacterized protein
MNSIFGRSMAFPPRVGPDGRFEWSDGEQNVRESIAVVLKTDPGERMGLPEFGAGLGRYLFEPNEPSTHARVRESILRSLARWERRIAVEAVDVLAHPGDPEAALVTIAYRLVATGTRERTSLSLTLAAR